MDASRADRRLRARRARPGRARRRYEEHLASCERCREELQGFWQVTGALAHARRRPAAAGVPAGPDPRAGAQRAAERRPAAAAALARPRRSRRSPPWPPLPRSGSASGRARWRRSSTTCAAHRGGSAVVAVLSDPTRADDRRSRAPTAASSSRAPATRRSSSGARRGARGQGLRDLGDRGGRAGAGGPLCRGGHPHRAAAHPARAGERRRRGHARARQAASSSPPGRRSSPRNRLRPNRPHPGGEPLPTPTRQKEIPSEAFDPSRPRGGAHHRPARPRGLRRRRRRRRGPGGHGRRDPGRGGHERRDRLDREPGRRPARSQSTGSWPSTPSATFAMQKGVAGEEDFDAIAAALEGNTVDLGEAIGSVYGEEGETAFLKLWRDHIGFFVDYTVATAKKDEAGQNAAPREARAVPGRVLRLPRHRHRGQPARERCRRGAP